MRTIMVCLVLLTAPTVGCGLLDALFCTEQFVYGMTVNLTCSKGQDPIEGATLTLTDGSYSETMMDMGGGVYVGAGERAGTYTLTIEAQGWASETINDVEVQADICHVIPEELDVVLSFLG